MAKERIGNTSEIEERERVRIIEKALRSVGRSVFFSVIIMIISFSPILFLTDMEKKLFSPLVLTKTFSLIGAAILAITVTPMLTRSFTKGKLIPESRNPVSNIFIRIYSPVLGFCMRWKKSVLAGCALVVVGSVPLIINLGTEFMPPLDEGSILLMPVTLPDASNSEIKRIMQVQDKIISGFPEVANILGKAGRAYTATDNAPLSMIESIIILKPKSHWRKGLTKEKLIAEMDSKINIPGVVVGWTQPIINRINMLSTGIRTDVGIKIYGQDLDSIYNISLEVESAISGIEGLADLYVEQLTGGKYLDIKINRDEIARYGINVEDINMLIETALGGMNITTTVEGRARFNAGIRLAQDFRSDLDEIKRIPVQTQKYGPVPLTDLVELKLTDGPPMINSENALLRGTVLFNIRGRDMGSVVKEAKQKIEESFKKLPKGYYIEWSGQYENQVRAQNRLKVIIPLVLLLIGIILYGTFGSFKEVLIIFISIPFALVGGVYSLYYYHYNFSVAVAVGFIALFGVAVGTGVIMIAYLKNSLSDLVTSHAIIRLRDISDAIFKGATPRVRPILMTNLANIIGLIPILTSSGVGSDVMKPITVPFVFGLISAIFFVLIVLPLIYEMMKERELNKYGKIVA